ncbi:N-acetyltransferase family protein [Peribacillus sp. B-H-3]|uniref:GNAT family N-acetyltransferase n=1 Tax=Peribacillus sp. B-H-3 TaxID=3400420 RepID=UPI003B01F1F5
MNIRLLNQSDAEEYKKIRLEALKDSPEAFSSSYEEEKSNSIEHYQNRIESYEAMIFGAYENGELTGIVSLVKESKIKLRHRANIYGMYVSKEKRKKGLGRELMKKTISKAKELKDIEQIHLSVTKKNEPAKRLYESLGFEVFGIDKNALKIGEAYFDEDHMVLFL